MASKKTAQPAPVETSDSSEQDSELDVEIMSKLNKLKARPGHNRNAKSSSGDESDCSLASVRTVGDMLQRSASIRDKSKGLNPEDPTAKAVPLAPSEPFQCTKCRHKHIVEQYVSPLPSHLLETNDPPLQSEEASLQQIVQDAGFDKEISALDDTVSQLETLLRNVKLRRTEVRASALAAKGVVSAIRRVPREIIIRIVLYALEDGEGSVQPTTLDVTKGPWVYSQVCRLWREEILGCRLIWSNIEIRQKEDDAGCRNWPAVLETVLSRAALHRGNLRFQLHLRNDSGLAKDLIQSIISNSSKWEEATLIIPRALLARLKRLNGRIPVLQSMRLGHTSSSELDSKCIAKSFEYAPALRRLSLEEFRDIETLAIPWDQLTHFHAGNDSSHRAELLCQLPHLVTLSLPSSWMYPNQWSSISQPSLTLHHLRTLDMSHFEFTHTSTLITKLILPALEDLSTTGIMFEILVPCLQRSKCSITHLSLHSPLAPYRSAFDQTIGPSFLAELSSLETLDLTRLSGKDFSQFLDLFNRIISTPQINTIIVSPHALSGVRDAFDCLKTTISLRKEGSLRNLHFKKAKMASNLGSQPQIPIRYAKLKRLGGDQVLVQMV
ncbi:hypothetical protein C8J56DRAFT_384113 [Mycena floridula]|nr:hypothetical protein C8J56DRAFT_384113 [Mycena floridula]